MAKYLEFSPVSISCISAAVQEKPKNESQNKPEKRDCINCPDVLICSSWVDNSPCKRDGNR